MSENTYIQEEKISFNYIKKEDFKGSYGGMRYLLKKQEDTLVTVIWPEPYCFENTKEEAKTFKEFEMTPEGKVEAVSWLNEQYSLHKEKWEEAKENAFRW